jgi:hypothetical protein
MQRLIDTLRESLRWRSSRRRAWETHSERNIAALRARDPSGAYLARYDEVARILTGRASANADDAAPWLRELCLELAVPPLARYGLTATVIPELVNNAQRSSSR